jgi:CitMHS family citrate-Mg2+:H+ or citrate-Ca2+:H+ symporter
MPPVDSAADTAAAWRRPRLVWINGVITLAIMPVMIAGTIAPAVMFMIGTALVLTINFVRAGDRQ